MTASPSRPTPAQLLAIALGTADRQDAAEPPADPDEEPGSDSGSGDRDGTAEEHRAGEHRA